MEIGSHSGGFGGFDTDQNMEVRFSNHSVLDYLCDAVRRCRSVRLGDSYNFSFSPLYCRRCFRLFPSCLGDQKGHRLQKEQKEEKQAAEKQQIDNVIIKALRWMSEGFFYFSGFLPAPASPDASQGGRE